jgi:Ser/Thr protein kinase RdoA (MazF antagonist)
MIAAIASRPRLVRSARGGVPSSAVRTALAAGDWRCERVLPTVSDTAVVLVRTGDEQAGLLKLAVSERGRDSLRREAEILRLLGSRQRFCALAGLIPAPLAVGSADGTGFLLMSRLAGLDARRLPAADPAGLTTAAFGAIAPLHRDARIGAVDAAMVGEWVDQPAALLRRTLSLGTGRGGWAGRAVERVAAILRARLAGARMPLGWTHGDFHPGNVLVGADGQVTGIVDWDQARERDIVAVDLAFWLLTVPSPGRGQEFGGRVAARLGRRDCWTPDERKLLGDVPTGRGVLLLAWLRHVAGNLAKSDRYAASPLWLWRNVRPVLRQVAGD